MYISVKITKALGLTYYILGWYALFTSSLVLSLFLLLCGLTLLHL